MSGEQASAGQENTLKIRQAGGTSSAKRNNLLNGGREKRRVGNRYGWGAMSGRFKKAPGQAVEYGCPHAPLKKRQVHAGKYRMPPSRPKEINIKSLQRQKKKDLERLAINRTKCHNAATLESIRREGINIAKDKEGVGAPVVSGRGKRTADWRRSR